MLSPTQSAATAASFLSKAPAGHDEVPAPAGATSRRGHQPAPGADIDDEVVDERVVRWRAVRRWRGEPEPLADWHAFRSEQDASH